ncbi:regulatory protein RecX [Amnibacterium kyonggiense]|uniref:Regulatory protein RecX n=1 Tax=Amnibacterium kyonggiense TaxID=595671 RepID=A0A4R7FG94_9MICO|nr:regulatory protein RecX [Amnibacterium kyonggiense]TDS75607.1 SOS response regulatory protein OraA/RecX [Amnibacterium kyonggiense]
MGELLQFPGNRAGSDEQDGVERSSAPSRHPAGTARVDAAREPRSGRDDADAQDEARWAVPGVDDPSGPPRPEPTRASKRAENVAIAALTRHDASEGELRAKLVAKGLEPEDVEAELDRLRSVGLVDDAAFAERLVSRLRDRKGLGDQAIRSTLRGRLVPQDVVDAVLAEQVEDEEVAADRLQSVADDRARRLGSLAYDVAERRLTAYLMRKGYSGSSVRAAVRSALASAGIG